MLDIHLKTKVFTHDPGLFVTDTELDIHLKTKVFTQFSKFKEDVLGLDIHLKTKVFTQYKLKYNESQLYITKN